MSPLFYSLFSVIFISIVSIGVIYLLLRYSFNFSRYIVSLVSLAVGSLFGDAFIHIIPESFESIASPSLVGFLIISGILLFFTIEKLVRWRHCHNTDCLDTKDSHHTHSDHIVANSLVGDFFHNFIDGVIIAASYLVSFELGLATTLAVLMHEIPQEIGDFAIYLHRGRSLIQSFWLNLLTAFSSVLGVIATFIIGVSFTNFSLYMLPVTAGGFIYLASSDLIPELHRHTASAKNSFSQILFVSLGVALMSLLLLLE